MTGTLHDLVERFTRLSHTWLPPSLPATTPLAEALEAAVPTWPADWSERRTSRQEPLLFPIAYSGTPKLSPAVFHQLVDACCEASRAGSRVVLVAVPLSRAGSAPDAGGAVQRIADALAAAGLAAEPAADAADLHGMAGHLVGRACALPFTRRRTDLPDLLVSAAADAVGTGWIYLADGVRAGRNLAGLTSTSALFRLTGPEPFAAPPSRAKLPPAGSDPVWATAFTLGLIDQPTMPSARETLQAAVRARVAVAWNRLRRADLVAKQVLPPGGEPARVRATTTRLAAVAVPLFGAPKVAETTRALVAMASLVTGTAELIVDDLTPRLCYRAYAAETVRRGYLALARRHGGSAAFLTDHGSSVVDERVGHALKALTVADLTHAVPRGRAVRERGGLTGFDALHLAIMATTFVERPRSPLALKNSNLAAMQSLSAVHEPPGVVVCSGTDEFRPDQPLCLDVRAPAAWLRAAYMASGGHHA